MGRDRKVDPDITRLYISDGDYIDVKKRLNHGEYDDHFARICPFQTPGEPMRMETRQIRTSKVLAYLVGWSLTHKGKPILYSPDMPENARVAELNDLDRETFAEIHKAIDAHEDKGDAEAAKNFKGDETGSSAISPSPVAVAGDTNGSGNSRDTSTSSS